MIASRTGRVDVVRLLLAARRGRQREGALVRADRPDVGGRRKSSGGGSGADRCGRDASTRVPTVLGPPKRDIADFRTDKNGLALQTLLTTFPKQGLTPLLFAARQGAVDAVRVARRRGRRPEPRRPGRHHADDSRHSERALRRRRGARRERRERQRRRRRRQNAAVHVGRHALAGLDSESADRPAIGQARQPRRRDSCCSKRAPIANAQLKAAPPGWKGDAVGAQNTFGGVLSAGYDAVPPRREERRLSRRCACCSRRAPIRTSRPAAMSPPLMALVGGLGRKYGADLQVSPEEEKNAMQAISLLLDRGADLNAANDAGQTALHAAAMVGANGVVRFLVDRGARLDAKNGQGRTPRDEALRGLANVDGALERSPSRHGGAARGTDGEARPSHRARTDGRDRSVDATPPRCRRPGDGNGWRGSNSNFIVLRRGRRRAPTLESEPQGFTGP